MRELGFWGLAAILGGFTWLARAEEAPPPLDTGATSVALTPAQRQPEHPALPTLATNLATQDVGPSPERLDAPPALVTLEPVTKAESLLPVPVPPETPAMPTQFEAPLHDPAGEAARAIARRVSRFRAYRAEIPGASWRVDEGVLFRIRADARCKQALKEAGVRAHLVERELLTPVPSPVALDGAVDGVTFHSLHTDREVEMACELAVRLPSLVKVLKRHGVRVVSVLSSYRQEPRTSFHTFGLALDLAAFRTEHGVLVVSKHFELTPDKLTCDATPSTEEGKALLAIACDLAASSLLSSVLTPNYNEGHHDHFHLDIRPDDPRVFLR